MHNAAFLQDLAVVMMVAGLVTVTFHALKLPLVLGYILAGVIIGPHVLPSPLVSDRDNIQTLSELDLLSGIRERVSSGIPYMGSSAGSNIAGPTIRTTNDNSGMVSVTARHHG